MWLWRKTIATQDSAGTDKRGNYVLFPFSAGPPKKPRARLSEAEKERRVQAEYQKAYPKAVYISQLLSQLTINIRNVTPYDAMQRLKEKEHEYGNRDKAFRETAKSLLMTTDELSCLFAASKIRNGKVSPETYLWALTRTTPPEKPRKRSDTKKPGQESVPA